MEASSFHSLTNEELLKCLRNIDPFSPQLSDLIIEMWMRGLHEVEDYGRRLMAGNHDGNLNRHPDTRLYNVLEVMCSCFDQPVDAKGWLSLASGYEQRILDVIMLIAVRADPHIAYEVLNLAERNGDYEIISKALLSTVRGVPATDQLLSLCLIRWALDRSVFPNTRRVVLRRLSELPRSRDIEDFFIRCYNENDGSDSAITDAINEALIMNRPADPGP